MAKNVELLLLHSVENLGIVGDIVKVKAGYARNYLVPHGYAEPPTPTKIGALIAIERSTKMGALSETGVSLDAVVSRELLETIFWPGTALHDLGVIVNQGRIVAAGCQFPLAESGDVDQSLGSRHRAALGVSQETDAVVVIVSEESGVISVAIHGQLQRPLTRETLREILVKELTVAPTKTGGANREARPPSSATSESRHGAGQAA